MLTPRQRRQANTEVTLIRRKAAIHTQPRLSSLGVVVALTLALLITSCGGDDKPSSTPTPDSQAQGRTAITFTTQSGKKPTLYAEIAQTIPELNVGLSNRQSLPPDVGMFFVLPFRGPGFWMKDTTIALSVAFIAPCGNIVGLADMQPLTDQLHNADAEYKFGLEVNLGWFARNGIALGDKVVIPSHLKQPGCP
jgi:uncharacterized membrane protein (UPF0127 family)